MFCKYCGSAIDLSKMKCTACGREVGQLAGGNSFWDLSRNPPQPEPVRADGVPQRAAEESAKTLQEIERLSGEVQKLRSSYSKTRSQLSKLALTSVLLSAVAIILCIVLALRVFLPPKNVDEPVENKTFEGKESESKLKPDTEAKIALRGSVISSAGNAALEGATVYVVDEDDEAKTTYTATTDGNGIWVVGDLSVGHYTVYAEYTHAKGTNRSVNEYKNFHFDKSRGDIRLVVTLCYDGNVNGEDTTIFAGEDDGDDIYIGDDKTPRTEDDYYIDDEGRTVHVGEDGQPHTPDDWYEEDKNGDGVLEKVYVGEDGIAGTDDDYWTVPIVFDANEGTIDGERYLKGDASTFNALPTATREGYDLDGWFTEADGGTKISLSDVRNTKEAKTFYAHWTKHAVPAPTPDPEPEPSRNLTQITMGNNYAH